MRCFQQITQQARDAGAVLRGFLARPASDLVFEPNRQLLQFSHVVELVLHDAWLRVELPVSGMQSELFPVFS